jgi:hypothetical protein
MVKYPHPDLEAAAAKARHADIRREAESWRLARQRKQGSPSWLSPSVCWLLCQTGNALVWLGRRLELYGSTAAARRTEPPWQAIVDRA